MTKIWRETGFVDNDRWIIETDELKATETQKPLLDLDALIAKAEESNDVGLGVVIKPADDVTRLQPYLDRLEIIAVAFPAFNDGRAFSHASLLRQRLGYGKELRAVGDVLIDQIPLMLRVGIDSFAVTNETALKRLSENRLPGIPHYYQPTAGRAEGGQAYSWRRLPAKSA
ncbi:MULTISPECIES: DUF934 domain-containing protein [unclassified Rhizobium]|jgi:uncharacterized protein (DUF934 family)|uniref:DUF934 domain-containing protein n=1 Tax=unclassified Rhizobium TaxID=2613769 RepID=UPI000645A3D4|nr:MULTISPECIES: DUF934 domain-containing protein [unclassified Rhizobium]MBN8952095.1 DUF934 domain-containing protein [Rhizobium tropici]OJY77961.1 MAG: oxidoreductase [Rhizobium sp. 60-20]RKD56734.1 uncharacterized protein (DUF934 family) [Rhizobium sp. WW_1]